MRGGNLGKKRHVYGLIGWWAAPPPFLSLSLPTPHVIPNLIGQLGGREGGVVEITS